MDSNRARSLVLKNKLAELERLARATEQFGAEHHLSPQVVYQINLVLDELVTNVISYGYADADEHDIRIRLTAEPGRLRLVFEDDGRPFNPLEQAPPQLTGAVEDREEGGLGIFLVRKMMDRVEYRREGNRNILVMEKRVPSPPEKETDHGNR